MSLLTMSHPKGPGDNHLKDMSDWGMGGVLLARHETGLQMVSCPTLFCQEHDTREF